MTAFITRAVAADSVFAQMLTAAGWEVAGQSLVRFSALPFSEIPAATWLFFYSAQGVQFFFQNIEKQGIALPAHLQTAAIGPGTARALARQGYPAHFAGTGDPAEVADALGRRLNAHDTVLFVQASQSRQSVEALLAPRVPCSRLLVYHNQPLPAEAVPVVVASVVAFTSPMNARAFFSQNHLNSAQRAVAIGASTAAALHELGVVELEVATAPDEAALAAAVLRSVGRMP